MATVDEMKNQMSKSNRKAGSPAKDKPKTIEDYLKQMAPAMSQALPKHMDIDRLMRLTMTTIRTTPELRQADVGSLLGGVMQAAQLGLEPGLLGQCYLLPFKNKKKEITEVQFIIGYKGMIDLARRSGHIQSIYAHAVYENDDFEYELGLNPKLKHTPSMESDKGAFIGLMQLRTLKMAVIKWNLCLKQKLKNEKMLVLVDVLNTALGIITTKKWQRKQLFVICGSTYLFQSKYSNRSLMTKEQPEA